MALPNAKSTLSSAIDTVTKPYANASCVFLLRGLLKQAPPFFVSTCHSKTNAWETEDRAQMSTTQQRADFVLVLLALKMTPWI